MAAVITLFVLCFLNDFIPPVENFNTSSKISWRISTPEEQGIDSQNLLAMLKKIKSEQLNIRGIIIIRNDHLILESYIHPYNRYVLHDVKSASKSIISALAGIALREGMIKNLEQKVCDFFPDYFATNEVQKKEITIRHLLTMTSGLEVDEHGPIMAEMMSHNDLIEAVLSRPLITDPGGTFTYCTLLTHVMAGILTKSSGMDLLEFSRCYLFEPMGITNVYWEKGLQGFYFGGDKLWLTPIDMVKFGYLYLNKGKWNGQQVIPETWVQESTQNQIKSFNTEGYSGYGYGWWLNADGSYHARGFGGQMISIYPKQNMVVVFTGADNNLWQQLTNTYILPAVKGDSCLPADEIAEYQLKEIIQDLQMPEPLALPLQPEIMTRISGKTYILKENELDFSELTFWFENTDNGRVVIRCDTATLNLAVGLDHIYRLTQGVKWGMKPDNNTLALRGKWIGNDTFFIDFQEVGEPFYFDVEFNFGKNTVTGSLTWKPMNWFFSITGQWD